MSFCPCESGKPYRQCCEIYHLGQAAPTAEMLMRSRYSAYAMLQKNPALGAYLLQTWHADTRPQRMDQTSPITWLGLQIKRSQNIDDNHAIVEFVARYKFTEHLGGKAERLHEISRFVRIDGRWYYLDGDYPAT